MKVSDWFENNLFCHFWPNLAQINNAFSSILLKKKFYQKTDIIWTCALSQLFFRPVQTSRNLVSRASSLFDVNVQKLKDPGDDFGPSAFVQDLHWCKGWRPCLKCRLFINFGTLILFKRNMAEKEICPAQCLVLWSVTFLFVRTFYTVDDF